MQNSLLFLRIKTFCSAGMKPRAMYIASKQPVIEQQCRLSLLMSKATLLYNCTHWNVFFLPQPSLTCMFIHFCSFVYLFQVLSEESLLHKMKQRRQSAVFLLHLPFGETFLTLDTIITVIPFHWKWKIEKAFLSFLCAEIRILVLRSSLLTPKGLCRADAIACNDNDGFYRA